MKLSILLSVYNAEIYIKRCLESLLEQDIAQSDYEILIRDDGSKDNTVEIIENIAQNNACINLHTDTNRGAYVQRNILMNQARGKYVYFVDADDYLTKNSLYPILNYAIENDLDSAAFGTEIVNWQADHIPAKPSLSKDPQIVSGPKFLEQNPDIRHEIWWYIIRNDFLKESGLTFEESRYHNDVMFTLKLLLKVKRMAYFPQALYHYFQSPNSIMRSTDRAHSEKLVKAGKSLIKRITELTEKLENHKELYSRELVDVFKYRRDKYAFYLILKMLKSDYSNTSEIISFTHFLEQLNIYPLKHYNTDIRSKSKFFIIKTIINNRNLIKVHSKFKRYI